MKEKTTYKTIAITGATGFLGQALIPFLLKEYNPDVIRLLGRSEYKMTQIIRGEGYKYNLDKFRPMIADIRDLDRMVSITKDVDLLIHCAALKRLEIINYCPQEAVLTNCVGSMNVLHCVINNNIPKSVWISSDKAVAPTNLYGATKKVMEEMVLQRSVNMNQNVTVVRYGNVIGSTGAVVPFWIDRAKKGLTLPITNPAMTRFMLPVRIALEAIRSAIDEVSQGKVVVPQGLKAISVLNAVSWIREFTGSKSEIEIIGEYSGEKRHEEIEPGQTSDKAPQLSKEEFKEMLKEEGLL